MTEGGGGGAKVGPVLQYSALQGHDTALGRGAWRARHNAQGASAMTRLGPATIRPGLRAPGRAWVPAGPVLVLVHLAWFLTWFFDSVVFLSHRLDPVHEHCSSQKISHIFFN